MNFFVCRATFLFRCAPYLLCLLAPSFFSLLVIGWGWGLLVVWHSYQIKVQVKESSLLVDVEIKNFIEG